MKTIYKYELQVETNDVEMPKGAEIIHVAAQGERIFLWAMVDTDFLVDEMQWETRPIVVLGTGMDATGVDAEDHIGTIHAGGFVWHVFNAVTR